MYHYKSRKCQKQDKKVAKNKNNNWSLIRRVKQLQKTVEIDMVLWKKN